MWWRDVPVDDRFVGETARLSAPVIRQVLIEADPEVEDQGTFERKLYVIRRVIERAAGKPTWRCPASPAGRSSTRGC